jgi:hypothetical protein
VKPTNLRLGAAAGTALIIVPGLFLFGEET